MNIFALDDDPWTAAELQRDELVPEMVLKTAQLVSTAVLTHPIWKEMLDGRDYEFYRVSHVTHPCSLWARETPQNFAWLVEHGFALGFEYLNRYGKAHPSVRIFDSALVLIDREDFQALLDVSIRTPFAMAMPEGFKSDNPVASYQAYYRDEKVPMLDGTFKLKLVVDNKEIS